MDENFNNKPDINEENAGNRVHEDNVGGQHRTDTGINNFSMDDKGNIRTDRGGTAAITSSSRMYVVLGWISAALTLFVSPWFAIAGIVFGILANRQARGSGNAVLITNVVLAAVNILFSLVYGLFIIGIMRRLFFGY